MYDDYDDSGYQAYQFELQEQEFFESPEGIDLINLMLLKACLHDTQKELPLYYE